MFGEIWAPIYFILPIFFANAAASQFGGGLPVDFGKYFFDGRRITGDGKTYRGLAGGILVGTFVATLQPLLSRAIYDDIPSSVLFGLIITTGSVVGDLVKSFFKRRIGIERGKPFVLVDQSDFVWGALIFYYLFGPVLLPDFFVLPGSWLVVILIVSPLIHFAGNIGAHALRLKDVWW